MLKQIHASVVVSDGQELSFVLASKLISLYVQFNDFGRAVSVLKALKEPNTFLWNSVIKAHVNSGLVESGVFVYKLMRKKGVPCDGYTFPILSKLVLLIECGLSFAEMVHCVAMQMGFESDVYFCNTMIEAYVKSGYSGNALKLFNEMPCRDLVSWTSMISGFAYEGNTNGAFGLFNEMRKEVEPNEVTMIVMLQTCSTMVEGSQLHGYVIRFGSLIDQSLKIQS
ncbi:UNVERIFIED_CONTAM: Pentatricopeptide repeat-containing protein [Sesamum latifolium]|uniref:Pentatricopeptide repeat-containing protein n=1 Tax=Sesamum latifolium TaxID=2727402 RepID=A0AAW2XMU1_9LAMI